MKNLKTYFSQNKLEMTTLDLGRSADSSDSENDEDYVPSGEESEGSTSAEDNELPSDHEESRPKASKTRKKHPGGIVPRKRRGGLKLEEAEEHEQEESHDTDAVNSSVEKSPVEDKKKADILWSDFLKDVDPLPKKRPVTASVTSEPTSRELGSDTKTSSTPVEEKKVEKVEVLHFAGEPVLVGKEVSVNSREGKELSKRQEEAPVTEKQASGMSVKRPGGAGDLLGQLMGKKQRISTLEKSKLDWNSYKKSEGIEGDLTIHNRGKDGYLEKQAFLQRADLRQFEIEKSMRAKNRLSNLI